MRVLLVSAHFRPHVGGVETFTETLAEGLAGRGHEVTVLCCRTDRRSPAEEEGAYRIVRVPAWSGPERRLGVPYPVPSPAGSWRRLRHALREADVAHVQDVVYATSLAAVVLARRQGVPVLVTQHVGFVPQGSRLLDGLQRVALAAVAPAARRAAKVVSYNSEVARWAERAWGLDRVDVLPVGVRPGNAEGAARREFTLPAGRFVALFVGRDVPKKGLDLFLGAADPAYDLVAVTDREGDGPGARLLPFMPPERLARLYASVDAFVLPSEAEGIPLALQEAMSHGLPVVTPYARGYAGAFGPTDVVPVERTAASVRAALLALASDPSERRRLAARSLAVAASAFSLDAFVDAYEEQLRSLAGRPPGPRTRD